MYRQEKRDRQTESHDSTLTLSQSNMYATSISLYQSSISSPL